ncbi:MAG: hypothetical protein A2X56_06240 [Nitrospirae bacterium GWC2_57_13]|jgi:hypothetical protein|nr:MAG: hypothetical protein A2X56_06240 [Nitrospirae bacterium GWC2_57_13]HAR45660.1 hypothetical protein [Nitrospiraceae bacterium]HAS52735.1 hypothetical protein [Nitrospiraceae bacterium]
MLSEPVRIMSFQFSFNLPSNPDAQIMPSPKAGSQFWRNEREMNTQEQPTMQEESIAIFVHPDEYARNPNQVASVTTRKIVFVKRKELAMKPFELVEFPLGQCSRITYETRHAFLPMMLGAFLVLLVGFILSSDIPAGTRVPVGALAIAFMFGGGLMFSPKRHRFTFVMNSRKLKWQSKAGDYKYKMGSTQKLIAFAREKGLMVELPPI